MNTMRTEEFYAFMTKRELIRQRKAAGLPFPWSDDPILNEYKFTNVKRIHDRTSFLLKAEFYDEHRNESAQEILFNAAVFRYFGTIEFARAVGWTQLWSSDEERIQALVWIRSVARARSIAGQRCFTGAYIVTSAGITGPKENYVCNVVLNGLSKSLDVICAAAYRLNRWYDLIEELQKCEGFGGSGFMAKETVLDLAYTNFWMHSRGNQNVNVPLDLNTWTPVGPGSMRGAARVCGRPVDKPLKQEETRLVCLALFAEREKYWPKDYPELELHDIQFQLCEFDKIERVRNGEGRPRSRYTPPTTGA